MRKQIVIVTSLVAALPITAEAASQFDGAWTVTQSCAPTREDVRGYSWIYPAVVRNGVLFGQHSPSSPQDGSGRLQGRINPDGSAMLTANGRTGTPEYSVGHVARGYPFHFHVQARFNQSSGTGSRVETRPCSFSFTRG